MSAVDGLCGSAEGRGILFDRDVPPAEKILQSFFEGEPMSAVDWEMFDRGPLTGRMECMFALGRPEKVAWRTLYRSLPETRRVGDDC
jgi:hypothetical protein